MPGEDVDESYYDEETYLALISDEWLTEEDDG